MKNSKILSHGFLIGLSLLLLNDLYLKDHYHNWWTGKISDFAGLFIFPIFLSLLNHKRPLLNYIFTFLLFIFWKTEISTEPINHINEILNLNLFRIIDYTDFIAFSILPFSYYYYLNSSSLRIKQFKPFLIGLSIFSFYATSAPNMTSENESRIIGRYHRIVDYETYNKTTLNIGFQDLECKSCYEIAIGPDIIAYDFNENFIIAKLNPKLNKYEIDTSQTEYTILKINIDSNSIYDRKNKLVGLTEEGFYRKRKELGIPDSLTLNKK